MTRQKSLPDRRKPPRLVTMALVGILLLFNLFVFSLLGFGVVENRRQVEERERIAAENLTKALEQDLADQIGKIDLALFALAREYTRQHRQIGAAPAALREAIADIRSRLPEIDVLSVADAAGIVSASVDTASDIKLDISDRDYFTRLKDSPTTSLIVGQPIVNRIGGGRILMFARRLSEPDGSFGGAVHGGILIERLQQRFADLDVGSRGIVALRDDRLNLVTRYSQSEPRRGEAEVSREFRSAYAGNPDAGIFVAASPVDQVDRLICYRKIGDYPLIVQVGLSREDSLHNWYRDLAKAGALGFCFLLVSVVAARAVYHSWQRQLTALDKLSQGEARLRMLAEHASDTISRIDPEGRYLYVSQAIMPTTGRVARDLMGRRSDEFIHPDDAAAVNATRTAMTRRPETKTICYRFRHKRGHYIWLESNIRPVIDDDGAVIEFVAVSRDITKRMQADAKIEFLAHHDPLTGLPNRLLAKDRMEVVIARADRNNSKAALLFLDLDHFKKINDSLGHPVGDELLKQAAGRLRDCLRETDTLCRQGGDEFLIILGDIGEMEGTSLVAETILTALGRPFRVDGQELSISASIGIAIYPDDGGDFDTLSRQADTAMYHAKEMGRNACRFFTEQMNADSSEYLRLRNGLRHSLDRGEMLLHYQPQFDLKTGGLVGVEALIRWNHPQNGLIGPARFIPIAEESGLIVPIGAWVLQEACRQAAAWREAGMHGLVVAVNLSAVQFKRGDLIETVKDALALSGLAPHCLELELTESILISDTAKVLATVEQLSELGVKLSIDDFGTGYSCLAYLKRFRFDRLKIDQSFVRHITTDANDSAIVQAIVQLARSLGLKTVAEGVEDEETKRSLQSIGCDDAQGYHFAKPMPAPEIARHLAASEGVPVLSA